MFKKKCSHQVEKLHISRNGTNCMSWDQTIKMLQENEFSQLLAMEKLLVMG
jgi:hypothetical protein